jgi:hypothetical protein
MLRFTRHSLATFFASLLLCNELALAREPQPISILEVDQLGNTRLVRGEVLREKPHFLAWILCCEQALNDVGVERDRALKIISIAKLLDSQLADLVRNNRAGFKDEGNEMLGAAKVKFDALIRDNLDSVEAAKLHELVLRDQLSRTGFDATFVSLLTNLLNARMGGIQLVEVADDYSPTDEIEVARARAQSHLSTYLQERGFHHRTNLDRPTATAFESVSAEVLLAQIDNVLKLKEVLDLLDNNPTLFATFRSLGRFEKREYGRMKYLQVHQGADVGDVAFSLNNFILRTASLGNELMIRSDQKSILLDCDSVLKEEMRAIKKISHDALEIGAYNYEAQDRRREDRVAAFNRYANATKDVLNLEQKRQLSALIKSIIVVHGGIPCYYLRQGEPDGEARRLQELDELASEIREELNRAESAFLRRVLKLNQDQMAALHCFFEIKLNFHTPIIAGIDVRSR